MSVDGILNKGLKPFFDPTSARFLHPYALASLDFYLRERRISPQQGVETVPCSLLRSSLPSPQNLFSSPYLTWYKRYSSTLASHHHQQTTKTRSHTISLPRLRHKQPLKWLLQTGYYKQRDRTFPLTPILPILIKYRRIRKRRRIIIPF